MEFTKRSFSCLAVVTLLGMGAATAQETSSSAGRIALTAAQRQEMAALIAALASNRFSEREEAVARLIEFGEPAIPLLAKAAEDHDPEVRLRVRILLQRMTQNDFESAITAFVSGGSDDLPGWDFARTLIGNSRAARELFVEATRRQPDLLAAFENDTGRRMVATSKAADLMQHRLHREFTPPERGDIVALLLSCGDRSTPIPAGVERLLARMMSSHIVHQTMRDAKLTPVFQKLVGLWIRRASTSYQSEALYYSLQNNFPASLELARQIVERFSNRKVDPAESKMVDADQGEALEYSLLIIAKYGTAGDVDRLAPLITDARRMPIRADQAAGAKDGLSVQVRDIAMAVSIRLLAGDLAKAGYAHVREHANVVFFTGSLGFPDDNDRHRKQPAKYLAELIKQQK